MHFPRFYFLSNDELIEIIAKASNMEAIQQNLAKCFEALVKFYFGPDKTNVNLIMGMYSPEGELVNFV